MAPQSNTKNPYLGVFLVNSMVSTLIVDSGDTKMSLLYNTYIDTSLLEGEGGVNPEGWYHMEVLYYIVCSLLPELF